jgi:uncharacterized coiled-coil protein SlyX
MGVKDKVQRLATPSDERLDRLEAKVERQGEQLARLRTRVGKQQAVIERQAARLERQAERLRSHEELVNRAASSALRLAALTEIVGSQVAALESRFADVLETAGAPLPVGDGDVDEARTLIEEVRAEHRRIRERFGVVTAYEERLRRLEDALQEDTARALDEFVRTARALDRELGSDGDDTGDDAADGAGDDE